MIMESTTTTAASFSSPRADAFPAGLRVLVVDDDPTWLKILEKMLKKCSYEVTTCGLAIEALDLLRERKDGFDIVISDVNMPDMDGFKLLEHVGLEMDLPVIMMSVDGETSRVMKGVQHGACDYLLKPIRMKELRNIWQHVFRKRIHEVRDIESHEGLEEIHMMRNGSELSEDGYFFCGSDLTSGKKRKDVENKLDDKDSGDSSSVKKARVVWTVELHQKFVKAVNQIGYDKVGPKKILDLMGVPWLTRENVASHLQKYRLYLTRLQKENELKASISGIKQSDISSKDSLGSFCLQNPISVPQAEANSNYGVSGNKGPVQNVDTKIHDGETKTISLVTTVKPNKAVIGDVTDHQMANISRMGLRQTFKPFDSDTRYTPTLPTQYSWSAEAQQIHFKQEDESYSQSETKCSYFSMPKSQHHAGDNGLKPTLSTNPKSPSRERDKPLELEVKSSSFKSRCQGLEKSSLAGGNIDSSIQPDSQLTNCHAFMPILGTTWSMKDHTLDQILIHDPESTETNFVFGSGPGFASWDEYLYGCSLQGDWDALKIDLQNKESFNYNNAELIAELPPSFYDPLRFDYENPSDSMEYPVIDHGLFIV